MALALVVGPAHAGKVALLLERYLTALDRDDGDDPWLVVPNRVDVERVERDLLRRRRALLAGRIGTFDDLFEHIVGDDPLRRPVASETQRALAIRRAIARTSLSGLSGSSSSEGFADSLLATLGEVESALVDAAPAGRRPGTACRGVSRGARPARVLGPRPASPQRRRAPRF